MYSPSPIFTTRSFLLVYCLSFLFVGSVWAVFKTGQKICQLLRFLAYTWSLNTSYSILESSLIQHAIKIQAQTQNPWTFIVYKHVNKNAVVVPCV